MFWVIPTPPCPAEDVSNMNRKYALRDPPPKVFEGFQAARLDALYLSFADPGLSFAELKGLFDIFILLQGLS